MSMVTIKDLENALVNLGIKKGDTVVVHSSLKSLGQVEGGPETVIQAFKNVITEEGTLILPALSQKDFPNAIRDWSIDRPSDTGLITEVFRKMDGTLRSNQETHSACAWGKYAYPVTYNHKGYGPRYGTYTEWAFAKSSPWQKAYHLRAKVVFIGVVLDKYTLKHMVEYILVNRVLDSVDKKLYDECKAQVRYSMLPDAHEGIWPFIDMKVMQEILDEKGYINKEICGDAQILALPAYETCNFMQELVESDIEKWMNSATVEWFRKYGKGLNL